MKNQLLHFIKIIISKKVNTPIVLILILAAILPVQFALAKFRPQLLAKIFNYQSAQPQPDTQKYLPEIKKLISLPDETPLYATVSDAEKINTQPFFRNARNGDVVLIFQNSRKTILYRPSENKIIEVGTVQNNVNPQENPVTPGTPSASPSQLSPKPSPASSPTP